MSPRCNMLIHEGGRKYDCARPARYRVTASGMRSYTLCCECAANVEASIMGGTLTRIYADGIERPAPRGEVAIETLA